MLCTLCTGPGIRSTRCRTRRAALENGTWDRAASVSSPVRATSSSTSASATLNRPSYASSPPPDAAITHALAGVRDAWTKWGSAAARPDRHRSNRNNVAVPDSCASSTHCEALVPCPTRASAGTTSTRPGFAPLALPWEAT
ncbi:hypothetical protein [Embleya sp. NPDC059237]|uniref:hypothetical protein n=1 Tax=Embleya sp. NPDC059237 TaxID=3346784 RepID=UPI0036A3ED46